MGQKAASATPASALRGDENADANRGPDIVLPSPGVGDASQKQQWNVPPEASGVGPEESLAAAAGSAEPPPVPKIKPKAEPASGGERNGPRAGALTRKRKGRSNLAP